MNHTTRGLTALAVSVPLVLAGCGLSEEEDTTTDVQAGSVDPAALEGASLSVGSKDFDEQLLLGQLAIQMLSAAGATVSDDTNIQGSTAARNALIRGEIDTYYDYTGTGWIVYLKHTENIADPEELYQNVAQEDLKENGLVWGQPAPFNNTYTMAVTEEFAEENSVATLSDMATYIDENPDSSVCVESEFAARPDGLPGMAKAYDMNIPESSIQSLGVGVIYPQIDQGECDFGEVFTTDGRISALGLLPLEDDKSFFPLYNGAPIVQEKNSEGDAILEVLAPLSETLTTEVMAELNAKVSAEGLPVEDVASDYLTAEGFIE
ncbi:MAG: glycine betaine ABC transporter substrate-binding protein [Nocardioidaceae bacterium]|nr:glycine betaine ABC transporter substrate-binding protein [Nocardioidaceae bacterium]